MAKTPVPVEQLPLIDDPDCREIYVDGITIGVNSGIARFECFVMRMDPAAPAQMNRRVVVARLVMTQGFAEALGQGLVTAARAGAQGQVTVAPASPTKQ